MIASGRKNFGNGSIPVSIELHYKDAAPTVLWSGAREKPDSSMVPSVNRLGKLPLHRLFGRRYINAQGVA